MSDLNQPGSFSMPAEKPKLPSGLNTLTILTFVGCGLGFLSGGWNFINAKKGLDQMEEMINSGKVDQMPAFARKMFSPEMLEMTRKSYENRLPILIITMLSLGLCLAGALQMRQLKMQGYYLYIIGELLPFIGLGIFLGAGALTGVMGIVSICIALLFIGLYSAQRKYLSNNVTL